MKITRRQSVVGVLVLLIASTIIAIILSLVTSTQNDPSLLLADGVTVVVACALLFAYLRGYEQVRYVILIALTLLIGFATAEPYITQTSTLTLFIPAAFAMILAEPIWMLGSSVGLLLILLARANWQGVYADPFTLLIAGLTVGGMLVAHLITRSMQQLAEEHRERFETQNSDLAAQAAALNAANQQMQEQIQQQTQLLDLVARLETPAVQIAEGVLLAPVVGHVDTRRAQLLMSSLLQQAADRRMRLIVLDIAGVSAMDTAVIGALVNIAQALRLLGCDVTISGLSAEVALTLTQLNINLPMRTVRSPQEALAMYSATANN